MGEIVISVKEVWKSFRNQDVLQNVNAEFEKGKIHGLVGRNGSGKTVLLKCICGLMEPTRGQISVNGRIVGKDVDFPQEIGFIIDTPGFLKNYSGYKNLKYLASIRGKATETDLRKFITLVGLDPDDKKAVGKYSMGMRQRLGVAQALMEEPDILILDEPMNGLDDHGAEDMHRLIKKLRQNGKTILLTSHNRYDIDELCDTVSEMDGGKLKAPVRQ